MFADKHDDGEAIRRLLIVRGKAIEQAKGEITSCEKMYGKCDKWEPSDEVYLDLALSFSCIFA
jgi:hypothetical protein